MMLIKDNSYIGVITSVRTLLKLLELNKKTKNCELMLILSCFKLSKPLKQRLTLQDLRARAANMSLPKIRVFSIPLSSGYKAWVKLYLPPEITVHTFTSYPLVVDV